MFCKSFFTLLFDVIGVQLFMCYYAILYYMQKQLE